MPRVHPDDRGDHPLGFDDYRPDRYVREHGGWLVPALLGFLVLMVPVGFPVALAVAVGFGVEFRPAMTVGAVVATVVGAVVVRFGNAAWLWAFMLIPFLLVAVLGWVLL